MTYFTHILSISICNNREWFVEEQKYGNTLHKVHKMLGLVFKTRDDCEDAIYKMIKKEGGRLVIHPDDRQKLKKRRKLKRKKL